MNQSTALFEKLQYRVTFGPMLAFLLFTFVIGTGLAWIVMAVAHA